MNADTDQTKQPDPGYASRQSVKGVKKRRNSRTLLVLIVGWIVVFGVMAWVLTGLKLGGTEPLKSDEAPTPSLGEPEVRG
jgi:hypothetical protein